MALPFLIPLIGAGLGALLNKDDRLKGALTGGGLGLGVGALAGAAGAGGAGGGLLSTAAPEFSAAIPVTTSVPSFVAPGAEAGLSSLLPGSIAGGAEFGAAGLSQGAAAAALEGGVPAAGEATFGLTQGAAAKSLETPGEGPIIQEFFGKGFRNKLTTGLIDAAPTAAQALLQPGQQAPVAPAGQLTRPAFNPAPNIFFNFQRRRK